MMKSKSRQKVHFLLMKSLIEEWKYSSKHQKLKSSKVKISNIKINFFKGRLLTLQLLSKF